MPFPPAGFCFCAPNGVRYPRVGGTGQHHFAGTSFEPRKLPENAQTPTRRVHAVLGLLLYRLSHQINEGSRINNFDVVIGYVGGSEQHIQKIRTL